MRADIDHTYTNALFYDQLRITKNLRTTNVGI